MIIWDFNKCTQCKHQPRTDCYTRIKDCCNGDKFEPKNKCEDNVNSPKHYVGNIETIDYIKDKLTPEEFKGAMKFNILKYVNRERLKNGIEDIKKAEWYIKKLIEVMEEDKKDGQPNPFI